MSREQYLIYRTNNSSESLYEYYKENYKGDKMLDIGNFFQAMSQWPHANQAFGFVLHEYDIKYNVTKIFDKQGNIIKFY